MTAPFLRASTLAAAVAIGLGLGACGGDDDASSGAATTAVAPATPATTATSAAQAPPATTAAPDDGQDAATEGGDTLALGTRVVAPYTVYGKSGTGQKTKLGVTALRVRKGRIADFKGFNLDAKQKATVPYYVEVKYENLGKLKLQRFLMDPSIEDSDGQEYKPLNLIVISGTFKKCPNPSKQRLQPGDSFRLCSAILLPKGKTYERVRFQGDVLSDPYFWK